MSPVSLNTQLESVGRLLNRWRAQLKIAGCAAGVLFALWLFSLTDLWLQHERGGRLFLAMLFWGGVAVSGWWIWRSLHRRFTPQSVAARVEQSFPQLDNHLINYLQFSAEAESDIFKQAYLQQGVPHWDDLNFDEMKNRALQKKANIAVAIAALLLLAPALFLGSAWSVSLYRVINPFTNLKPVSLTNILSVNPGTTTVPQGEAAVLSCSVKGAYGHRVFVDIHPSDGERTVHALGRIAGTEEEEFSFKISKVNAVTRYRFRAGDAALPEWYTLTPRPPLAIQELRVQVIPPAYTGLEERRYDGLSEDISIPAGSELKVALRTNHPVNEFRFRRGEETVAMEPAGDPNAWRGVLPIKDASAFRLVAAGNDGDALDHLLPFAFEPDRLPGIKIISPVGRPVLSPGATPTIDFTIADDYGLTEVAIEQVIVGASRGAEGKVLKTWPLDGRTEFSVNWQDTSWHSRKENVLAYRVVARDNFVFGDEKRFAASPRIVFYAPSAKQVATKRNALEKQAFAALTRVIELQRQNIAKTKLYQKILTESTAAQWQETADRQTEIRALTRELIANPLEPLGTLAPVAKKLYLNEMAAVIPQLANVPNTAEAKRPEQVAKALRMEEKILRQFSFAESAASKAKVQRRVSALSSMLRNLIKEEMAIMKETERCATQGAAVGEVLINRQDDVALDLTDFRDACKSESAEVTANDKTYADLLMSIANLCDSMKIRDDMMLAAGKLDENQPKEALLHEMTALKKLKELEAKLDAVQAMEGLEEKEMLMEAVLEAKKRLEKMEEVYKAAIEQMEMVGDMKDKSTKDTDLMEEEYEELVKNLKEALLQVPTDLNIFMELNVANDIVEDVFSIFEEIEQAPGSEDLDKEDVTERALAKREEYLEGMEEAKDRLDNMESWLGDKPDSMEITTEAFDQEEMPEAGIALGALKTEAEDLIGDLLESNEEADEEADDSATNTSVPDMVANNEVKEGDVASFAAQGKSGNETPDHKEQDGRSNVGRQGMSTGETAAGSGTINEGDQDIEERRTQDPTQSGQVDVEGEDVKTNATGGGKLGTGKADDIGMDGGTKRMDSTESGSAEGMDALMAQKAEGMYAKASMQNVRADSLKDAAHHLRQANDAMARGNIAQMKEHRKAAIASLKKAQAKIDEAMTGSFNLDTTPSFVEDVVEGGPDAAPPKYRDQVAEYYKSLNKSL